MSDTRVCKICHIEQPIEEFYKLSYGSELRQHECRTCAKGRIAEWKSHNRLRLNAQRNRLRSQRRDEINARQRAKYASSPSLRERVQRTSKVYKASPRGFMIAKQRLRAIKDEVYQAYGGYKCACCGIEYEVMLTIDHIGGKSPEGHSKVLRGDSLYARLRRDGFPSGFRVLCYNCNIAEARGGCPHQFE